MIKAMVLLLGNYPPDQQQSMQRFSAMMLNGLTAHGVKAELLNPEPFLGKFVFWEISSPNGLVTSINIFCFRFACGNA